MSYSNYVSGLAQIGENVKIGPGTVIYDNVKIGDNCFIGPNCVIGEPTMNFYKDHEHSKKTTEIGHNSIIRSHTVIYEDVRIGHTFQTGHNAIIREGSDIGNHSSFGSNSELPGKSKIGNFVRIHSKVMLSECNIIEDYVWIFPFVVITNTKYPPVGGFEETHIKKYAVIAASSILVPGITIGENSIVAAGSIVTKNVNDGRLVMGNPAKDIKAIEDITDKEGKQYYPWRDNLSENRGYPWQNIAE